MTDRERRYRDLGEYGLGIKLIRLFTYEYRFDIEQIFSTQRLIIYRSAGLPAHGRHRKPLACFKQRLPATLFYPIRPRKSKSAMVSFWNKSRASSPAMRPAQQAPEDATLSKEPRLSPVPGHELVTTFRYLDQYIGHGHGFEPSP